ncbi:MAG: hypothetical protein CVU42_13770 [Chloroflexi bacterium HGW-Chloroflexi-4]|nr:MAG: hypothetical protein CVU42_13770 [Chloroflexi bacterium HGW-Chloroflexi-4]
MSSDESVVSNIIFWTGLHRVEIIRFAQPVDEDYWVKKLVPDRCMETYTCFDWVEDPKGLKLNHLYVNWKERGAVDFSTWLGIGLPDDLIPPVKKAVLWYGEPGEGLYFSIDMAATLHKRAYGVMPSTAWVRTQPLKAKKRIDVGEGADQGTVELMNGLWVPERFVVVGIPD